MQEAIKRIQAMSDTELQAAWDALEYYDPREYWDSANNVRMDDWAELIYSEMDKRGIPHF